MDLPKLGFKDLMERQNRVPNLTGDLIGVQVHLRTINRSLEISGDFKWPTGRNLGIYLISRLRFPIFLLLFIVCVDLC